MTYLLFADEHPVQYGLRLMRAAEGDEPGSAQRQAADTVVEYIVRATRPCVAIGVLRGDPEYLTLRLWSALHGTAALRISQPHLPRPATGSRSRTTSPGWRAWAPPS